MPNNRIKRKVLLIYIVTFLVISVGCASNEIEVEKDNQPVKEYTGLQLSFSLPERYEQVKTDTDEITLVFKSPNSTIKVFNQELSKTLSSNSYIEYGNEQLYQGKAGFTVLEKEAGMSKGAKVQWFGYQRPEITTLTRDENYYFETHVIKQKDNCVITFWGKTDQANYASLKKDIMKAVVSVERKKEQPKTTNPSQIASVSPHVKYSGKQNELEIGPNKIVWGRFFPGVPYNDEGMQKMLESESKLAHKFDFVMTYITFPGEMQFPEEAIKKIYEDERVLMLTLQPFTQELDWIAVLEIINGKHDAQIREWAEEFKKLEEPIFVRPLNEMNGDWDPWCAWFFGKDTDLYIESWRHIVNIFREVGADNVLFVWNPHDRSYPNFKWNNAHLYYPGDDYVDWVGLTGYNNGTSHPGDVWREFDEIYQPLYADYLKHYPDKPFMITEFSCNEVGGNKAKWIEKGMASLAKNYPNIKIATWFDNRDNAWLYQLDSSPEAFEAFKKGLKNEGYLKKAVTKSP